MSLDVLKRDVAALDPAAQKELMIYLASLRENDREERARRLAAIRDNPDPNHWVTPEEFKRRLDQIPEPAEE